MSRGNANSRCSSRALVALVAAPWPERLLLHDKTKPVSLCQVVLGQGSGSQPEAAAVPQPPGVLSPGQEYLAEHAAMRRHSRWWRVGTFKSGRTIR